MQWDFHAASKKYIIESHMIENRRQGKSNNYSWQKCFRFLHFCFLAMHNYCSSFFLSPARTAVGRSIIASHSVLAFWVPTVGTGRVSSCRGDVFVPPFLTKTSVLYIVSSSCNDLELDCYTKRMPCKLSAPERFVFLTNGHLSRTDTLFYNILLNMNWFDNCSFFWSTVFKIVRL